MESPIFDIVCSSLVFVAFSLLVPFFVTRWYCTAVTAAILIETCAKWSIPPLNMTLSKTRNRYRLVYTREKSCSLYSLYKKHILYRIPRTGSTYILVRVLTHLRESDLVDGSFFVVAAQQTAVGSFRNCSCVVPYSVFFFPSSL